MDVRETVKVFAGSVIVYVVIAACGASEHSRGSPTRNGAGQPPTSAGGSMMAMVSGGANGTSGATVAGGASGTMSSTGGGVASTGGTKSSGGVMGQMMDPVPPAHADPTSGSRLRAKYVTGSDGSKQFLGWHDSMRSEDCTFQTASDGMMRCVPATSGSTSGLFTDSGCTNQALAVLKSQACRGAAKYALVSGASACGYKLVALGATVQASALYSGTPGSCSQLAAASASTFAMSEDFYASGGDIDPSAFVAGTTSVE